jgi:hypothetical protein
MQNAPGALPRSKSRHHGCTVVSAGQGGPSGGGKTDGPREGAAENGDVEPKAAERGEGTRRKQGKVRSREYRREANGLSLHIAH